MSKILKNVRIFNGFFYILATKQANNKEKNKDLISTIQNNKISNIYNVINLTNRIEKPRLFLSHSKSDTSFISRIDSDLRRCQIRTWLDNIEIRPGEPWLDSIFHHGIPSCDAIFVYLTIDSLRSKMVQKEIDASIIHQLNENDVAFLPYIKTADLRSQLRPDLMALQVPVWNTENYYEMLPSIVSEIWRSYSERLVERYVQNERVARLEAELKLEKSTKGNKGEIFSRSEQKDLEYVWGFLDRKIDVEFQSSIEIPVKGEFRTYNKKTKEAALAATINIGSVVVSYLGKGGVTYSDSGIRRFLIKECVPILKKALEECEDRTWQLIGFPKLENDLLMYGLLENLISQSGRRDFGQVIQHRSVISEKVYRLRYWLATNNNLIDKPDIEIHLESLKIISKN